LALARRPGRQLSIAATRATADLGDLPPYVTLEEITRARRASNRDTSALIGFLWATGARISEALAVTPADLDVDRGAAKLRTLKRSRKDGTGQKKTPHRICPIPGGYLSETLAVCVANRTEPDRPIWNWGRQHAWRVVSAALQAAGCDRQRSRPHAIRHGHAVHAVLNGVPLNLIQRQLGHASITTTAIYLRVTAQDVREAYGRFEW
jgi:site-specific recombinase XerD